MINKLIYAVIDNGIISNTIIADDEFANLIAPDHDLVVNITDMIPIPAIGWELYNEVFRPPRPGYEWEWDDISLSWVRI